MDIHFLEDIGLTNPQARAYKALVESGQSSAPAVAKKIGESRTNTYKVLDKLCEHSLATKDTQGSRVSYFPASPVALELFVQKQAATISVRERKLSAAMPDLLDHFYTYSEQPGIRYFRGEDGLINMYKDQINTGKTIYFIRGHGDIRFLGDNKAHRLRNLFPANGIDRYCIIQDVEPISYPPGERMPIEESDKLMRLHRTWVREEDYDEPVEWVAYGDKVAILSFGQELTGMIIESPQVARSFRKIFKLLDKSLRQNRGYHNMPQKATYTRIPIATKLSRKRSLKH